MLRAQVAPVAELHSLWADLGTVSENVEHARPQLQAVCDTVGQAIKALQVQDDRLTSRWASRDGSRDANRGASREGSRI